MVRVVWAKEAIDELDQIRFYVEPFDDDAAARLTLRLLEADEGLADYPARGRPAGGARRALTTVWLYLIFYRVEGNLVRILSVRHGARRPQPR